MAETATRRAPKAAGATGHAQKVTSVRRNPQQAVEDPDRQLPVPDSLMDLDPDYENERVEMLKKHAPECLNAIDRTTGLQLPQSSEFVELFADPEKPADQILDRGYTPVMDAEGHQVKHRSDPLFKIPREMWVKRKSRISRRSHAVANEYLRGQDDESAAEGFHVPK